MIPMIWLSSIIISIHYYSAMPLLDSSFEWCLFYKECMIQRTTESFFYIYELLVTVWFKTWPGDNNTITVSNTVATPVVWAHGQIMHIWQCDILMHRLECVQLFIISQMPSTSVTRSGAYYPGQTREQVWCDPTQCKEAKDGLPEVAEEESKHAED